MAHSSNNRDSPLLLLPNATFSSHIFTALGDQERKALRLACKGCRLFLNAEVKSARCCGQLLTSGGLTLARLIASCPHLNCLTLSDSQNEHICGQLLLDFLNGERAADVEGSASAGAFIRTLDVKECNFLQGSELQLLVAAFPLLERLSASRWSDGSHLRALAPLANCLIELDLGDNAHNILTITDKSLAHLPKLPALQTLSLRRCVEVTDAGIAHLTTVRLPALTSLDLSHTRVSGASGFPALSPELRKLALQGCRAFGDAGLAAVVGRHAGSLRELHLHGTAVQPGGSSLWHLAQATGLEVLDLGSAWEVDRQGLAALSCCRALSELRLGNFNLRPPPRGPEAEGPAPWAPPPPPPEAAASAASATFSLPSLTRLSLGGMFCQQGLELLRGGMPQLRRLDLAGLDTVRDQVLAALVGSGAGDVAASLQELHLARGGPDLTAAGLLGLAALPRLRRLTLLDCPCAAGETSVRQLKEVVRRAGRQLDIEVVAKPSPVWGVPAAPLVPARAASVRMEPLPQRVAVLC